MASFTIGSDSYGRVKEVGGVPVITKFLMLSHLPICPLQSFYHFGGAHVERHGIPFLLQTETVEIVGLPLARLDWTSITMTYVRAFAATLVVIGCLVIFPGAMRLTGEQLDPIAMIAAKILLGILCAGIALGVLTYARPWRLTTRERRIRTACGQVLGVAIDPARLEAATAAALLSRLQVPPLPGNSNESQLAGLTTEDHRLCRKLAIVRAQIGRGEGVIAHERETDEVLMQLPPGFGSG